MLAVVVAVVMESASSGAMTMMGVLYRGAMPPRGSTNAE